jgi:hypothetical protein
MVDHNTILSQLYTTKLRRDPVDRNRHCYHNDDEQKGNEKYKD